MDVLNRDRARTRWTRRLALLVPLLASTCVYDVTQGRCDLDPELCSSGDGWTVVAGCADGFAPQVEAGQGDEEFSPLLPGQRPTVLDDGWNNYVTLAVRVRGLDPAHRRSLVSAQLVRVVPCTAAAYWPDKPASCKLPYELYTFESVEQHDIIVDESWVTAADGALVRSGIQVSYAGLPNQIRLTVTDECGRTGSAVHEIAP
ncbi:MAG: hypothetical protein ACOYOB_13170 [Myxococcota bacterium]